MTTTTLTQSAAEEEEERDSYENVEAEMEEEDDVAEEESGNGVSVYEQTREERIKENLERMHKLGIFDMSMKLQSAVLSSKPVRKRKAFKAVEFKNSPVSQAELVPRSTRRSSRLQNVTPVSYVEVGVESKGSSTSRSRNIYLEVGSKPEVYTEKHDKLLGECNMSWTLFVDGYGKDGKRIYDPVRGKTCHQCRQKTLGHRTTCSNCNMVQGQFCGDCLYMRYGEHVLEANQNPEWICPPCRGICNCSLCRQAKGWAPTGPLYRKIASLGYKSVAHYLFQTHRSQTVDESDTQTKTPSDTDNGKDQSMNEEKKNAEMHVEDGHIAEWSVVDPNRGDNEFADKAEVGKNTLKDGFATDNSTLEVADDNKQKNTTIHSEENGPGTKLVETDTGLETPLQGTDLATKSSVTVVCNDTNENEHPAIKGMVALEHVDYINTPDKTSTRKKRTRIVEPSPDSVGGRLRLRRKGLWNSETGY